MVSKTYKAMQPYPSSLRMTWKLWRSDINY